MSVGVYEWRSLKRQGRGSPLERLRVRRSGCPKIGCLHLPYLHEYMHNHHGIQGVGGIQGWGDKKGSASPKTVSLVGQNVKFGCH